MITPSEIRRAKILIVDDQESNVKLLEYMLAGSGYQSVSSTTDARDVFGLYQANRYDLVVLDLNMPHMDGFQVIAALKTIENLGYVPVLVVTAEPAHKLRALEAGAKDFISKPFDNVEVLTRIQNMIEVRLLHRQLYGYNASLEELVLERTADLHESYRETVLTMTCAAEYKDTDTGLHIQRVGFHSKELALRLGMGTQFCDEILYAAPMHDIGKIAIPDEILLKQGPLAPAEWVVMKTHTTVGAKILAGRQSPYLRMGEEIALNHHERWDGGGYPNGLAGEAIPLAARIMNICDIYDALRGNRPYKPAIDHARALDIIARGDGRTQPEHFDPAILDAFTKASDALCEIYQTYSEKADGC